MKRLIDLGNMPEYDIILTRMGRKPFKLSELEKRLDFYIDVDDITEMIEIYEELGFYMDKVEEIIDRIKKF